MMYVLERVGSEALIVGQAPAKMDDPDHPITGRTGKRLARLLGMDFEDFLRGFDRVNLIDAYPGPAGAGDRFPRRLAEDGARAIRGVISRNEYKSVLLLGQGVAKAFGERSRFRWRDRWYATAFDENHFPTMFAVRFAVIPHPSGVNRWWNDPDNVEHAERFLRTWREELCRSWEQRASRAPARAP